MRKVNYVRTTGYSAWINIGAINFEELTLSWKFLMYTALGDTLFFHFPYRRPTLQ
jgi:hypothetical protein